MTVTSAETTVTLTCFSEVLENLFEIADVSGLSDDHIAERLLVLRDKCYLSRVTFKQLIMQTRSLAITGSTGYNLSSNSKMKHATFC